MAMAMANNTLFAPLKILNRTHLPSIIEVNGVLRCYAVNFPAFRNYEFLQGFCGFQCSQIYKMF